MLSVMSSHVELTWWDNITRMRGFPVAKTVNLVPSMVVCLIHGTVEVRGRSGGGQGPVNPLGKVAFHQRGDCSVDATLSRRRVISPSRNCRQLTVQQSPIHAERYVSMHQVFSIS